ncbi:MAG: DHA2 family efflux MFS transporter permease subunit [Elusimicrobia bacterium]|nr:DHA2 family efflux MFS transporter permease subunit [Elusimicrobiota bacterium]
MTQAAVQDWRPRHSPWLVAVSVMLATIMEVLDTSIANVALPHMAGSLSVTPHEATWVITSYLVSNAIVLSAAAWLARYFGRKRYLAFSVVMFTVASAACGMAWSLPVLVVARILQGLGGGGLQPLAQAVLLESFPPEERGSAMAAYGMGVVVAPIIGPTMGGWITDHYSWRWIFYINLPIGLAAVLMQNMFLEDPPYIANAKVNRVDGVGFGLMALGVGLAQLVLDKGQEVDWFAAPWVRWATGLSLLALACFVLWELEHEEPIMHLRLLKDRNFAVATVIMAVLGAALYATTVVLPIFMQTLLGYTAYLSGLAMSPRGVGAFISMMIVGKLIKKVDPRVMMGCAFLGLAAVCSMFTRLTLEISPANIILPLVLNGICLGFIFVPNTTLSVATLRQESINQATSIYSLLRNLGASVGISIVIAMEERAAQAHQPDLVAHLNPYNPAFTMRAGRLASALGGRSAAASRAADGLLYAQVLKQSQLLAFTDVFRWLVAVTLVSSLLVLLFRVPKRRLAAHAVME